MYLDANSVQHPSLIQSCIDFYRKEFHLRWGYIEISRDEPAQEIYRFELLKKVSLQDWKTFVSSKNCSELKMKIFENNEYIWKRIKLFPSNGTGVETKVYDALDSSIEYKIYSFTEIVGKISTSQSLPRKHKVAIANSFSSNLTAAGIIQNDLIIKYFSTALKIYRSGIIYASYTSLCQSSGFGKSRGAADCGLRLGAIYGVFRKVGDDGFPLQASWVKKFYNYINDAADDDFPASYNESSLSGRKGINCLNCKVGRVLIFVKAMILAYCD